ncbi:MAG: histidine phosphatase family protein [Chloroflexota bacterium]
MTNLLYLVRHGENRANITKEFSHRLVDYPLTPKGILQAQQTAVFFRDKDIHEIYSSPLKRARQTAEIIAVELKLPVTVVEDFREINVGDLEGKPPTAENWSFFFSIVESWFSGTYDVRFPGGEDYYGLWHRMRAGIEQIVADKTGRNIIIVGHGGAFIVATRELCSESDMSRLRGGENHNCSITQIAAALREGRLVGHLIEWASHAHLTGAAAHLIPGTPELENLREVDTLARGEQPQPMG